MRCRSRSRRWSGILLALSMLSLLGGSTAAGLDGGALPADVRDTAAVWPIVPCRVMDTRAGDDNVGDRATPLGAGETVVIRLDVGRCDVGTDMMGVVLNVTIVNPTAASYLTLWPADGPRPLASNLNWAAGDSPKSNSVTVGTAGRIDLYNHAGLVDVVVDIDAVLLDPTARYAPSSRSHFRDDLAARLTPAELAQRRWDKDRGLTHTVALPAVAHAVAFDGTAIWTADQGGSTVRRVDPTSEAVTAQATVQGSIISLMGDGAHLWVASLVGGRDDRVSKLDPVTGASQGSTLVVFPRAMVSDGHDVWVEVSGALIRIDGNTMTVAQTIPLVGFPSGLVYDGRYLWAARGHSDRVTELFRIDPGTGVAVPVSGATMMGLVGLAFDGASVWAVGLEWQADAPSAAHVQNVTKLWRVDREANAETVVRWVGPVGGDLAYDGTDLWVLSRADLRRIDPVTGAVEAVWSAPAAMMGGQIAFDGKALWYTAAGAAAIIRRLP